MCGTGGYTHYHIWQVGNTPYGGLRYCKEPTTYTTSRHYYSEEFVMMPGQACDSPSSPYAAVLISAV